VLQVGFVHPPLKNERFGSAPCGARERLESALVAATVLPILHAEEP
jgi:hypothetical protein